MNPDSAASCLRRRELPCFVALMSGVLLPSEDRADFPAMMRLQTNSAVHRPMNALLLDDG